MKRKRNFKQMFLIDNTLYNKLNTNSPIHSITKTHGCKTINPSSTLKNEAEPSNIADNNDSTQKRHLEGDNIHTVDSKNKSESIHESTPPPTPSISRESIVNHKLPIKKSIPSKKYYDPNNPIIKALKKNYEENNTKKNVNNEKIIDDIVDEDSNSSDVPRKSNGDIDYSQMIKEIDIEIKNWEGLRKNAIRRFKSYENKKHQPLYVQYFTSKDGSTVEKRDA